MSTLVMSLAMIVVVLSSLALGIYIGYAIIVGILNAFSHARPAKPSAGALIANAGTGD
ncbi:MAG TPA: hypothetical protein VMT82_01880 [candidate division Zixibacteria bacterium]|nr:hypothetical protein [candidate division Zixibacteria bacterium]